MSKAPRSTGNGSRLRLGKKNATKTAQKKRAQTVSGQATGLQARVSGLGRALPLVLLALVVVLATAAFVRSGAPEIAAETQEPSISPQEQQAGAFALNAMGSWFTATKDQRAGLDAYLPETAVTADKSTEYRDLVVASIEETAPNTVNVVITAQVKETPAKDEDNKDDKKESEQWIPRWYQVSVTGINSQMTLTGPPAPIGAPAKTQGVTTVFSEPSKNAALDDMVGQFLNAYAADQGQVERYISPDSQITPITPAPYESLTVTTITHRGDIGEDMPQNGTETQIRVRAEAKEATGARGTQYLLTVKVRDGRWEVVSIDTAPKSQPTTETTE